MAFWTLYKRELNSYFQSIVAYIVLFSCAVLESCFFLILMRFILESHYKERSLMQIFFTWPLFWLLMLGPVPLLTMRVFSEEFKLGTIEMLLTAPVREWDVVLAKFFGAFTFFLITWLPIVLDLAALQIFSNPAPPLIWSQLLLTAMTLALLGGFYVSLGVFASVLTRNQIVAAVLSYVSGPEHFENAVEVIFDTRPIVFYLTITAFFIMLTQRILQARRLKG
jgi:ABC-2 type transport system permease protein